MNQTPPPINCRIGSILFFLFSALLVAAPLPAQEFKTQMGQPVAVTAKILTVAGNINADRMSISYNGLSTGSGMLYNFGKNLYLNAPGPSANLTLGQPIKNESGFKMGKKLKLMADYVLKYFNVDDLSSDDAESQFLMKSKVNTDKKNLNDFEFNMLLNIKGDDDTILKMNAIKVESVLYNTYVNAVYDYDKSEIEFGVSCGYINQYLLNGMILELQANPNTGSGALLLTMRL